MLKNINYNCLIQMINFFFKNVKYNVSYVVLGECIISILKSITNLVDYDMKIEPSIYNYILN